MHSLTDHNEVAMEKTIMKFINKVTMAEVQVFKKIRIDGGSPIRSTKMEKWPLIFSGHSLQDFKKGAD